MSIQVKAQQNSIGILLKSHNSLYLELRPLLIQIPAAAVTHNPGDDLSSTTGNLGQIHDHGYIGLEITHLVFPYDMAWPFHNFRVHV